MKPVKDITAKATWTLLTLDKKFQDTTVFPMASSDGRTFAGLTSLNEAVKTDSKNLGYEIDGDLTYDYTEDVTFGLSAGWFVPGTVFASTNRTTASQVLTNVAVAF